MNYDLLMYLPFIITAWTSLNLSWGIFTGVAVDRIMQHADAHHGGHRQSDQNVHAAVWTCNTVLFMYLFIISGYMYYCADVVLVFNVFITSFLAYINLGLSKWYYVCNQSKHPSRHAHHPEGLLV